MIDAINSYYHKMAELKDDPYLETREREEEFIKRITHGVMEQLTADLPKVVGAFLIGLLAGKTDGVSSIGRALAEKYTSGAVDEKAIATSTTTNEKVSEINADISGVEVADNEYLDLDNIF